MCCIKKRKTQEEKSREMKTRLIEATLICLQERGYHGTSISEILNRAGVSRGAWRHHYNNKKELVVAAAKHFLKGPIATAREMAPSFKNRDNLLVEVVDYIWENFYQGTYRDIWLEFNVACRTDAELKQRLKPVIKDFFDSLDELWREHFSSIDDTAGTIEILMNLTLYSMRGMAIQSIILDEPDYYRTLRNQWITILSPLVTVRKDA
ncbi:MAG: TetR/AcrR family transcriptional regulator [Pseudomonadota bacterium]